jgi:RNA polymerase sigma-70 factor (ECF subfamily)
MTASDLELATAAARGDRSAFDELVRRSSGAVTAFARRLGAPMGVQDDLVQDAFFRAYKAIGTFRGEAAFAAWVMRITARLYLNRYRTDLRTEVLADPVDENAVAADAATDIRLDLDRALAQLSEGERVCVTLCHGAGLTHQEISQSLKIPLGTVKSHVTRGLAKLRVLMADPKEARRAHG